MSLQQTAQAQLAPPTEIQEALVIGGGNENWIIQSDTGTYKARKAVSCLVNPEMGDKVLSVSLASGGSSILAILDRKPLQKTHLKFDGDLDISASRSIRMAASERIEAVSGDKMHLDSSDLSVRTKLASVLFERLNSMGNESVHSVNKLKVMAKYLETVSETSKQVMNNSFRLVSGLESTKAGEMIQSIKKRFTVQSQQASILAEEDAKVNGKRVHLG